MDEGYSEILGALTSDTLLLISSSFQLQRIAGAVQAVCDAAVVGSPGGASGRRLLLGDAALRQGGHHYLPH